MSFAKEELMLSVQEDDPLAKENAICLHNHTNQEISVYSIYGAFEREIKQFLDRLRNSTNVTTYTDYFVF